eukprot:scaffold9145_cov62-Phaeocystis_antarctica.AAC.2
MSLPNFGRDDLQDSAEVLEHARRPWNHVAAVGHQAGGALGCVLAHDRLRRSERVGEPGDLAFELGPGRACLVELAAHGEVRDVRDASPERLPGEESALHHSVKPGQGHDRFLVPGEGVLDQVDVRAVRVDVLGLARPARGCQQRVLWAYGLGLGARVLGPGLGPRG